MKIVLDTNCLLVIIPKQSIYRPVFDALLQQKFSILISNDILSEYEELISNKMNGTVASNIIELLLVLDNVEKKDVFYQWCLIHNDLDDNKYVDCAIAGNADYIVTNDKHFNVLQKIDFPKIKTLSLNDFLKLLTN